MVIAALIWGLAQANRTVYVQIDPEQRGILLRIAVDTGHIFTPADPSYAKVVVTGPDGNEPVSLTHIASKSKGDAATVRVDVDRSPRAGWRTMTVIDTGLLLPTSLPKYRTWFQYYLPQQNPEGADEALRKKWIGKKVWPLGSAAWQSLKQLAWNPMEPVTVASITRIQEPVSLSCENPVWNIWYSWKGGAFFSGGCLKVILTAPLGAWILQSTAPTANDSLPQDRMKVSGIAMGELWLADGWHFDRVFRTTSPEKTLQHESSRVRNAFRRRELVVGMPRALAALLYGDPEPSAPLNEVWHRNKWDWLGSPFDGSYSISFDSSGRVTTFGRYIPPLP